jgi:hypothetical protein
MGVVLKEVNELAVFVDPGQLKEGCVYLVAFCDAQDRWKESMEGWDTNGAICLYRGPPQERGTPILEAVARLIESDPHSWSSRPCGTCISISALMNRPFGCSAKASK